jgi:hypothetical protein
MDATAQNFHGTQEPERKSIMNEKLIQPAVELTLKLTDKEANLLRLAMTRAASEEDSKKAGKLFFRSLRERASRFTLAELP